MVLEVVVVHGGEGAEELDIELGSLGVSWLCGRIILNHVKALFMILIFKILLPEAELTLLLGVSMTERSCV